MLVFFNTVQVCALIHTFGTFRIIMVPLVSLIWSPANSYQFHTAAKSQGAWRLTGASSATEECNTMRGKCRLISSTDMSSHMPAISSWPRIALVTSGFMLIIFTVAPFLLTWLQTTLSDIGLPRFCCTTWEQIQIWGQMWVLFLWLWWLGHLLYRFISLMAWKRGIHLWIKITPIQNTFPAETAVP